MHTIQVLSVCLLLGLTVSVTDAYTARISLCLCAAEGNGLECGFLDGVMYNSHFIYVDDSNQEFTLPLDKLKTYPRNYCSHAIHKRFLVDLGPVLKLDIGKDGVKAGLAGAEVGVGKDGVSAGANVDLGPLGHLKTGVTVGPDGANAKFDGEVHAGVVDANGQLNVDTDGHASGGVGGTVNVAGVELGGNVNVSEKGDVSGGASVGVGLGALGGVNVHVTAGPDGVKTGVGAHVDVGPVHGSAGVDVDQNGKVETGAQIDANLGPLGSANAHIGVDSNGNVNGGASGSLGVGPANIQGGVNLNNGQVSGGVQGNVGVGPANLAGGVNVNGNGQVSGGVSGSVGSGPLSAGGNINVGSNGQVSGGVNLGPLNVGIGGGGSSTGSSGSQTNTGSGSGTTGGSGSGSGSSSGSQSGGNVHPNLFNPGAMMSNLPKGGRLSVKLGLRNSENTAGIRQNALNMI